MCLSYSFIISRLTGLRTERRRLTNNCLPLARDCTTRCGMASYSQHLT